MSIVNANLAYKFEAESNGDAADDCKWFIEMKSSVKEFTFQIHAAITLHMMNSSVKEFTFQIHAAITVQLAESLYMYDKGVHTCICMWWISSSLLKTVSLLKQLKAITWRLNVMIIGFIDHYNT